MKICKKFNTCNYGNRCPHAKPHNDCNISQRSNCYNMCDHSKLQAYDRSQKLKKLNMNASQM